MAYNGAGVFQLVAGNPVVTGTIISSTWANNTLADIANNGLSNVITKDGQTTPTANIPFNGNRLTGVGDAVNSQDATNARQIQNGSLTTLVSVAGTDTITANSQPTFAAYAIGQQFKFTAAGANTTNSVTLNINGIGAKNITQSGTSAILPGDIKSGSVVTVTYDGTQFQIVPSSGRLLRVTYYFNNSGVLNSSVDGSAFAPASSTFTAAPGTTKVRVIVAGAGGGGGGAPATAAGQCSFGSGGGGGGSAQGVLTSGFNGVTVVCGAAGAGVAGSSGTNGGTSSFGAISATGGTGGVAIAASAPTNSPAGGASGGVGSGATLITNGSTGLYGWSFSSPLGGIGGTSLWGGSIATPSGNSTGANGGAAGAGGSGASNSASQGARAGGIAIPGWVIVEEFA